MGDPLSLAASILTLLGAGGAIGRTLKKVVALRHAPAILLALNNEVADLDNVVRTIDTVLHRHKNILELASIGYLGESLDKIRQALSTFENLISYELTVIEGKDSHLRLDKSTWLRAESKVRALKDELRAEKADVCLALSVLTQ